MHLIHNPVAGRGRSLRAIDALMRGLSDAGLSTTLWTTTKRGEAAEITSHLPSDAVVVAVGGDGTVNEVARACVGTKRTLGVAPAGSGDDFAHALGLPRNDLARIVTVLATGRRSVVDTGLVDGEVVFVNGMGMGFDAEVGARKDDAPRGLTGLGAYGWAVATCLRDLDNVDLRLTVDGTLMHEGPSLLVSCMNGRRTGGSFPFAPDARLDDGVLDVLLARGLTRSGTVRLLPRVMAGRHIGHRAVSARQGRVTELTWTKPRALHVDGEIVLGRSTVHVETIPASLHVIVP